MILFFVTSLRFVRAFEMCFRTTVRKLRHLSLRNFACFYGQFPHWVSSSKIRSPDVSSTKEPANSVRYTLVFRYARKWLILNFISDFCWKLQRLFTSCLADQVRKSCRACIVHAVRRLKLAVSMSKRKDRRENIEGKVGNVTVLYPGVLFFFFLPLYK